MGAAQQVKAEGAGPVIVVIEDEAIVLAGYQMLFESWGYRVVAASSFDDALSGLIGMAEPPAFILADYRLKDGLTGTDAIKQLRTHYGAAIPSVVVTGDTAIDRLPKASPDLAILHKPVTGRQLQDILRRSLGDAV